MEEIKFRAWDKSNFEMVAWGTDDPDGYSFRIDRGEIQLISFSPYHTPNGEHDQWLPVDAVFQQYTEYRDSEGVEVYDGDIIEWQDVFEPYRFIAEIKRWEDRWVASNPKIGMPNCALMVVPKNFKIIGNIYGNPELLGEAI